MPKLKQTLVKDYDPSNANGRKIALEWRRTKKRHSGSKLRPGELFFARYYSDKVNSYDKYPIMVVLRSSNKYTLAFNFNWLSRTAKTRMVKFLINAKAHDMNRLGVFQLTKKLRTYGYPREAYRLYFTKILKKFPIYKIDMYDVYEALSHNMVHEVKV